MSISYSHADNIALLIQSIKELNILCKQFVPKERGEKFIIRTKMMDMLAQQAFKYSIAVSYLKESEYHSAADTLDNVCLRLRRVDARNMANQYGRLATRDYDAMIDSIELIDERLKTIKVVCVTPLRKINKKCVHPVSAVYPKLLCLSSLNPAAKEWVPNKKNTRLNPAAKEWTPKPILEKTPEQKEADAKCAIFTKKMNMILMRFQGLRRNTTYDAETRLTLQCKCLIDLFHFTVENKNVLSDRRYHRSTPNTVSNKSIVQMLIQKSEEMKKQINEKYDKLRTQKQRSNPELRGVKIETLDAIKRARKVLMDANRQSGRATH
jgi:hypothetical protein